mmetsp:Transcript_3862/g.7308  ORF Transcript_3862/g.7308 Transcript_3862/m.7308 type:complete len:113 (+) Transcript_3862:1586-1924(+)
MSPPPPVLKVWLEAEGVEDARRLAEALELMAVKDLSLLVTRTEGAEERDFWHAAIIQYGLGELHVEVALEPVQREQGLLNVQAAPPMAECRETLLTPMVTSDMYRFPCSLGR